MASVHPLQSFLLPSNIDLLWEIIVDNENIAIKNPIQKEKIVLFFKNMIREFYQREKDNYSQLMNMNKAFITTFFTVLNTHYNSGETKSHVTKQDVLMTHEQIQEKRLHDFDKDLERRKNEFTNAMSVQVPPAPTFHDIKDSPLEEMDFMVKQMTAKREMELVEMNNKANKEEAERWLQGKETSVKNDKYVSQKSVFSPSLEKQEGKKFIQITDEPLENIKTDFIDLNKQLTWGEAQVKIFSLWNKEEEAKKTNEETQKNNEEAKKTNEEMEKIQKQITQLHNTLEAHMEKCNNTLSIIYGLLVAKKSE